MPEAAGPGGGKPRHYIFTKSSDKSRYVVAGLAPARLITVSHFMPEAPARLNHCFPFHARVVTSPRYSTFQPGGWDRYPLPAAMPVFPRFFDEARAPANCGVACGAQRNRLAPGERSCHAAWVLAAPRPSSLYVK